MQIWLHVLPCQVWDSLFGYCSQRGVPTDQTNPLFLPCALGPSHTQDALQESPCCLAEEQQGSQVLEAEMVESLNIANITKRLLSTVANCRETAARLLKPTLSEYAYWFGLQKDLEIRWGGAIVQLSRPKENASRSVRGWTANIWAPAVTAQVLQAIGAHGSNNAGCFAPDAHSALPGAERQAQLRLQTGFPDKWRGW